MKSQIKTVDAILADQKSFPIEAIQPTEPNGIKIGILGFKNVRYREKPGRVISKIINPSTKINE